MTAEYKADTPVSTGMTVVTCGLEPSFLRALHEHIENYLPFVKLSSAYDSVDNLSAAVDDVEADVALLSLDQVTNAAKDQDELIEAGFKKIILVTKGLDPFHTRVPLREPYVEMMYERTPMRIIAERMVTFESSAPSRLYTNVHPENEQTETGKNILFYSAKGGVGKTTVCLNTAVQLSQKGYRILVIDFATFGSVGLQLQLPRQERGLSDIIGALEQPSIGTEELNQVIQSAVTSVEVHGHSIDVLTAGSAMKMTSLDLKKTDAILEGIQDSQYDFILMDTSSDLTEKNIALMSSSTDIMFLTTTDLAANWALLAALDLVDTLNKPMQNRYLILNHYQDALGFPVPELESILSMNISVVIPDKYEQIQGYANRGILIAEKSNLKLNRHYRQVAHLISPVFTAKERGERGGKKRQKQKKGAAQT
ncbi:AAA family ATPase [Salibacterium halotolerans]|uniref:MinD-like ATPase involved in chromosome partitioning or flagellar assembly n=1 Tax=Salibacterium halotolerans TaxID=1884432 RepID=A0A1I5TR11_9BACI|nr:AAA family ATPase [Salibacterium halotolerans]SFP85428.1 MinD-like ATPase involved in chromosome partitioning or flagellar assembly [Salibacterium halotolerans]